MLTGELGPKTATLSLPVFSHVCQGLCLGLCSRPEAANCKRPQAVRLASATASCNTMPAHSQQRTCATQTRPALPLLPAA